MRAERFFGAWSMNMPRTPEREQEEERLEYELRNLKSWLDHLEKGDVEEVKKHIKERIERIEEIFAELDLFDREEESEG